MAYFATRNLKYLAKNRITQNEIQHIIQRNFHCSTRALGSIIPFNLSDIGEGIREVSVKEWFVKEGDKVSQFDNICEVQSDKASVTITSRYDGIIKKIHYGIDQTALVGKPLIDIEVEDETSEQTETKQEDKSTEINEIDERNENLNSECVQENDYSLCIPSVRRLARQYKIDLKNIQGTGKKSRILKEDVLRYLESKNQKDQSKTSTINEEIIKIKGFQRAMLQTMTASLKIPHFVFTEEVQVTKLSKLRKNLNTSSELNVKLSLTPFFIKALSLALSEFPILNSTADIENESVIMKKNHNIGVAMDTKAGLAVPVIQSVENKSVLKIAAELQRLMENGKNGNFSIEDLKDGTFTFSNIGVIGGLSASPVILAPQVAIVALTATKLVPRFDENSNVVPVEVVNMSGAADHRIIDGATMAKFINCVKKYIENPYLLLLKS